jgi:hypothetical protein
MSNPQTMESLMLVGLVPQGTELLEQHHIVAAIANTQVPAPEAELLETTKKTVRLKKTKKSS